MSKTIAYTFKTSTISLDKHVYDLILKSSEDHLIIAFIKEHFFKTWTEARSIFDTVKEQGESSYTTVQYETEVGYLEVTDAEYNLCAATPNGPARVAAVVFLREQYDLSLTTAVRIHKTIIKMEKTK